MQQALEALEFYTCGDEIDKALIAALRKRLAQPEPVDSNEKAGAYMDARLWEFIDMAAAWPEARPDPRTWDHVLVYAPKQRNPVSPQSPCEMTQAERKMFRLGWLECEAAHGIGEKPDAA